MDSEGHQNLRNDVVVSSLGFSLLIYPRLELKKPGTQKHKWAQMKKSSNKSLLPLAKGQGKEQPGKTTLLDTNLALL